MPTLNNSVELLNYSGGDEAHACAAWTSTNIALTDDRKERIPALLKMLADSGHGTPFERSYLHFSVLVDTATHIHLLKHRIGFSINGESARYKELKDDKSYVPTDWPMELKEKLERHIALSQSLYHSSLEDLCGTYKFSRKRAKETARFFLPYAHQVRLDLSCNFRSFVHFQGLRNSEHAQKEVRDVAEQMLNCVRSVDAFKHSLNAFGLSLDVSQKERFERQHLLEHINKLSTSQLKELFPTKQ